MPNLDKQKFRVHCTVHCLAVDNIFLFISSFLLDCVIEGVAQFVHVSEHQSIDLVWCSKCICRNTKICMGLGGSDLPDW